MNNKVKSLIASGVLIVGMTSTSLALETFEGNDSNTCIVTEKHTELKSIKLETEGGKQYNILNDAVIVSTGSDNKMATVVSNGLVNIEYIHMKGGNGFNCYNAEDGFVEMVCPLNNGGNIPEISHITIFYTEVTYDEIDVDGDGVTDGVDLDGDGVIDKGETPDEPEDPDNPNPPEDPDEPDTPVVPSPPTGDTFSMVSMSLLGGVSGLVLIVKMFFKKFNKKNNSNK